MKLFYLIKEFCKEKKEEGGLWIFKRFLLAGKLKNEQ